MPLTVFTNIVNPHNRWLFTALRNEGSDLRVVYETLPSDLGRPWPIEPDPRDVVTGTGRAERAELRRARAHRGVDVVLTGSYTGITGLRRRVLTVRGTRSVWWWGERLRPAGSAVTLARRAWFGAQGLDGVLAIGTRAAQTYREVLGGRIPIHVFPYATTTGLHEPRARADEPLIGYAGRLKRYKGVDILIRALAALAPTARPTFEVAGSGPQRGALTTLARDLGVDVHWLGELDETALDAVRARWWAQVVPSRSSEGWGLVVNEALGAGVPVIASAHVGSAHDLVRNGFNGTIVPLGATEDPGVWAAIIDEYVDRAAMLVRGDAARRVGHAFCAERAAPWLLHLIDERPDVESSFVDDAWASLDDDGLDGIGHDTPEPDRNGPDGNHA